MAVGTWTRRWGQGDTPGGERGSLAAPRHSRHRATHPATGCSSTPTTAPGASAGAACALPARAGELLALRVCPHLCRIIWCLAVPVLK
eukprot:scaffold374_cov108-Isochrysis_galbana.AAC.4